MYLDMSNSSTAWGTVPAMRSRCCAGIWPEISSQWLVRTYSLSKIWPTLIRGPLAMVSWRQPWSQLRWWRSPSRTSGACPTCALSWLREVKPTDQHWNLKKPDLMNWFTAFWLTRLLSLSQRLYKTWWVKCITICTYFWLLILCFKNKMFIKAYSSLTRSFNDCKYN